MYVVIIKRLLEMNIYIFLRLCMVKGQVASERINIGAASQKLHCTMILAIPL